MQKTVIVLGGPNGAGKTTFARQLLLERLPSAFEFLNADLIAESLSPFKPHKAAMRAGREFINRFDEKAKRGESFVVESTLSGLAMARRLLRLQSEGYRVELVYLWLPDAEFAVRRVSERVKRGGHDIDESVIRRRFGRSYPNFTTVYQSISDRWVLLDGSATPPSEIASRERGTMMKIRQPSHVALSRFLEGRDRVEEAIAEYGSEDRFYTENLEPVLEAVGDFLRVQEAFSNS